MVNPAPDLPRSPIEDPPFEPDPVPQGPMPIDDPPLVPDPNPQGLPRPPIEDPPLNPDPSPLGAVARFRVVGSVER